MFAVIVLGLSAHLTSLTERFFDGYLVFAAMGIAVAILTILTFPVLLVYLYLYPKLFLLNGPQDCCRLLAKGCIHIDGGC